MMHLPMPDWRADYRLQRFQINHRLLLGQKRMLNLKIKNIPMLTSASERLKPQPLADIWRPSKYANIEPKTCALAHD